MNSFFFKKTIARFLPRCNLRNHNKPHETHSLIFPQQRTSPNFSNWGSNFAQFVQNSIDSGMYYIVQCRKYTINRHQLNISLSPTDKLKQSGLTGGPFFPYFPDVIPSTASISPLHCYEPFSLSLLQWWG